MADENPKYDVAISFLYQDLPLAQALSDKLRVGLDVFFFPGNQEALAGTEGLESMREPFRHESRLNVVLFRPGWGKTRWTAVEELAIKESCLENSFRNVFVYVIEKADALPKWLPDTHVYFSSAHYSLEEAVGAIKARAQDRGGEYRPLTPAKKAELNRAEEDYRRAKASMFSEDGIAKIFSNVKVVFQEIRRLCDEVNSGGDADIEYQESLREGATEQVFTLSGPRVGIRVIWSQRYRSLLDDSFLGILEFSESMIIAPGYMRIKQPQLISDTKFDPEISRALEYGWRPQRDQKAFLSSKELASQCVIQFLDLVNRDRDGKVRRESAFRQGNDPQDHPADLQKQSLP